MSFDLQKFEHSDGAFGYVVLSLPKVDGSSLWKSKAAIVQAVSVWYAPISICSPMEQTSRNHISQTSKIRTANPRSPYSASMSVRGIDTLVSDWPFSSIVRAGAFDLLLHCRPCYKRVVRPSSSAWGRVEVRMDVLILSSALLGFVEAPR